MQKLEFKNGEIQCQMRILAKLIVVQSKIFVPVEAADWALTDGLQLKFMTGTEFEFLGKSVLLAVFGILGSL